MFEVRRSSADSGNGYSFSGSAARGKSIAQQMKRAWLNLRYEKQPLFGEGLKRFGYAVMDGVTQSPRDGDILVTWNRIHIGDQAARVFEARGFPVLVAENASWGNEFAGQRWYTVARSYHSESGRFPVGGSERWDSLGVEFDPWRTDGETVVLPSRGIGPACNRMPAEWTHRQTGRVRAHPGRQDGIPLREDLRRCARVITWGSGAAIKALMWGIKVESHMPNWIGEQNNTDADRLRMFRELAWGQARHSEIESGEAFERLLTSRVENESPVHRQGHERELEDTRAAGLRRATG
jgi:hypothetical protein